MVGDDEGARGGPDDGGGPEDGRAASDPTSVAPTVVGPDARMAGARRVLVAAVLVVLVGVVLVVAILMTDDDGGSDDDATTDPSVTTQPDPDDVAVPTDPPATEPAPTSPTPTDPPATGTTTDDPPPGAVDDLSRDEAIAQLESDGLTNGEATCVVDGLLERFGTPAVVGRSELTAEEEAAVADLQSQCLFG